MEECFLNTTEKYSGPREGYLHRAQLTQYPVPLINTNPLLSEVYSREDIPEAVFWFGGRDSITLTVSITHPDRSWKADQVQSPASSFFRDKN